MLLDFLSDYDTYQELSSTVEVNDGLQVSIVVTEGDTRPLVRWTVLDEDGVELDISAVTQSVTLYYRRVGFGPTLWKQVLTKTNGGSDGLVEYRPGILAPFLPSPVPDDLQVPIRFHGELLYEDTVSGARIRFRNALVVDAYYSFVEP